MGAASGDLADGIPSPHMVSAAWWTARVLSTGRTRRAQLQASYLTVPTGGAVRAEDMLSAERLLVAAGLAVEEVDGLAPTNELLLLAKLDSRAFCQGFLVAFLAATSPVWLAGAAADGRVRKELIPANAMAALAESLPDDWIQRRSLTVAASAVRRERQAEIGLRGEQTVLLAVVGLLADAGCADLADRVAQVSLLSSSYGYDIWAPTPTGGSLHLEVKTCAARTPYHVHLTRYEAEVAGCDTDWRLVICAVEPGGALEVAGLCDWEGLRDCVPIDARACCRWESAELTIATGQLAPTASLFGGS